MSYDPQSNDAMFSRVLAKLDEINDKADRIEAQAIKTNGRVTALERWRDVVNTRAVMIAGAVSSGVSVLIAVAIKIFF